MLLYLSAVCGRQKPTGNFFREHNAVSGETICARFNFFASRTGRLSTKLNAVYRRVIVLAVTMVLLSVLSSPMAAAYGEVVENVAVEVTSAGKLPSPVADRMALSIAGVAEQLMLGSDVATVTAQKAPKERMIREVFDKVLVGYSVENVTIAPGEQTLVKVRLIPWSVTVQSVTVNMTVEGMAPEIEKLVRRDMAGVESLFADILQGMPLLAMDWTQGVLKRELRNFMEHNVPEFRADFDISPTHNAVVNLTVYPKMPTVRKIRLFMRSDTVPNFALLGYRDKLERQANELVGVPVGFVERHKDEIAVGLADFLDGQYDFRLLSMKTRLDIDSGEEVSITSRSDSERYRLRLEGWVDVGRKNDDDTLKFRLHAGTRLSKVDELFVLADFAPQDVQMSWNIGYGRDLSSKTTAEIRYDPDKRRLIVGGSQLLLPNLRLRYERNRVTSLDEWGLRYRLHDFMSFEYVANREENWLRVIGHF